MLYQLRQLMTKFFAYSLQDMKLHTPETCWWGKYLLHFVLNFLNSVLLMQLFWCKAVQEWGSIYSAFILSDLKDTRVICLKGFLEISVPWIFCQTQPQHKKTDWRQQFSFRLFIWPYDSARVVNLSGINLNGVNTYLEMCRRSPNLISVLGAFHDSPDFLLIAGKHFGRN